MSVPGTYSVPAGGLDTTALNIVQILDQLGLGDPAFLKWAVDIGALATMSSSSDQTVDDLVGSFNFYRGVGSGGEGVDPTFNGTPGAQTAAEYLSTDGSDYCEAQAAPPSWVENFHKTNAKFTILATFNIASVATFQGLMGSNNGFTDRIGVALACSSSRLRFVVCNNSSYIIDTSAAGPLLTAGVNVIGVSVDEAATTGVLFANGATYSFNSDYVSPTASNEEFFWDIMSLADGQSRMQSGGRFYNAAMFDQKAFTAGEFSAAWEALRFKFGLP